MKPAHGHVLRRLSLALSLVALLLLPGLARAEPWVPPPGTEFDIQFTAPFALKRRVEFLDLDLFDTRDVDIAALKRRGVRLACYLNAGAWENWRPDADDFPAAVLGKRYVGYPDERWLDIRRIDLLAPIMRARLDLCRARGFDSVDPDNINGVENETGFPLTDTAQLAYNRWLAAEAHARGLSIGLKNALTLIPQLVGAYDWAVNESCFRYDECERLLPFKAVGKAVFVIEYPRGSKDVTKVCKADEAFGFEPIFKREKLDGWLKRCPG